MEQRSLANRMLALNTLAFTVCFAVWTTYGVLAAFLVDNHVLNIDKAQLGWLIRVPVLSGSLLRLPIGLASDRFGGKPVYIGVMLVGAIGVASTSLATEFWHFVLCGLLFGTSGAAFAVGIAYTSIFFPKEKQGTALGIFGVGNAGSAVTTLLAPTILTRLTDGGQNIEGWRKLPLIYSAALIIMTIIFALLTVNRKPQGVELKSMADRLAPLKDMRVWRFGVYYFLVFGAFVALSQWLVPYYLSVYGMSLATAGLMASIFSLPSGLIRALGGWASDKYGARVTMYWVLSSCVVLFSLVIAPRMDITSPGESVFADRSGTVRSVTPTAIQIDEKVYKVMARTRQVGANDPTISTSSLGEGTIIWPKKDSWQEPAVQVGQQVKRKMLSGLSAAFPLMIKQLFGGLPGAPDPLKFAFLGPLVGASVRALCGPIADKVGGAKVTAVSALGLLACSIAIVPSVNSPTMSNWGTFLYLMLGLFFFAGIGNASTFKQMPMIFPPRQAGGVIGWTSAIAAYGPFLFSVLIGMVMGKGTNAGPFFIGLAGFFALNMVINWWFYARKGAEKPC